MGQHAERRDGVESEQQPRRSAAEIRARVVGILAGIVRWAGLIIAVILVVHVVLTVGNANPQNGITGFFADWADPLALGFRDLFTPSDPKLFVLVNFGIAALFWLIVSAILAKIIRRFG